MVETWRGGQLNISYTPPPVSFVCATLPSTTPNSAPPTSTASVSVSVPTKQSNMHSGPSNHYLSANQLHCLLSKPTVQCLHCLLSKPLNQHPYPSHPKYLRYH